IPSVAKAFIAPRFCAKPTATITWANSFADSTCNIVYDNLDIGCTRVAPPTVPTDIGNSSSPTKFPSWSIDHVDIDPYVPNREAYACAPASTARQSLPVAITTGSIPFIIPLLCVTARYGSEAANSYAWTTPSRTSSPEKPSEANSAGGITQRARARQRSAKLDKILKYTFPLASFSTDGANDSNIVLIMFAPIASHV